VEVSSFLPPVLALEFFKVEPEPFENEVHVAALWRPGEDRGIRQLVDVVASGMRLVGTRPMKSCSCPFKLSCTP